MSESNRIGPMVHGGQVEDAVIATLIRYMPTYLADWERMMGFDAGVLLPPESYATVNSDFDKWPEQMLPAVVLVCPGLYEEPVRYGRGDIRARWAVALGVVTSAGDERSALSLAKIYAASIRTALLQHQTLWPQGTANGLEWLHEAYDDLPNEDARRSLAVGKGVFWVEMEAVVNTDTKPPEPPDIDDPGPHPTVLTTDVQLIQEAIAP